MNSVSDFSSELTLTADNETSIINRREIEPLLARARQILLHYEKAMDCSAAVVDRDGKAVRTPEFGKALQFCEFCKKHLNNSSQIWQGDEYPCGKVHLDAMTESRRSDETYVYTCPTGFIYWTTPVYRNGRYAGALIAGQVLTGGRNRAMEKFHTLCGDRNAVEKFSGMTEEIPEKSHDEIRAMARILGICAREISEKGGNPGEMIRRTAWQRGAIRSVKEPAKIYMGKNRPAGTKPRFSEAAPQRALVADLCPGDSRPNAGLEYPLESERKLLAAFRRGDNETGVRILKELMDCIITALPGNLEIIRFRAIELVVLLSRAAASDSSGNLSESNNRYLRRIQEARTSEELIEDLHLIAERMASKIFSFKGIRHASVLRKAERYIWENYTRKISLDEIAKASGLSAPYFSTIFKEEMGENLSGYLNRLRIEKAAALLTETGKSLSEIAGICGFEDQSWFSKIFKNYTGMSPGKYRENGGGVSEFRSGKNHTKKEMNFPESSAPEQTKENKLSS